MSKCAQNLITEKAILKTENAVLQKRLDNAVELPCKMGDTVFTVFKDKIKECKVTEIRFVSNLLGITWAISGYSIEINATLQLVDCHFGVWWFTDREAAEARLSELKEV